MDTQLLMSSSGQTWPSLNGTIERRDQARVCAMLSDVRNTCAHLPSLSARMQAHMELLCKGGDEGEDAQHDRRWENKGRGTKREKQVEGAACNWLTGATRQLPAARSFRRWKPNHPPLRTRQLWTKKKKKNGRNSALMSPN